ncbi:MAG TPA: chemotaxis protein CheW [Gemmatimonadales bacterium]|nr:chemotaxis protein CheW [Gemmatimonadales bacterium]
MSAPRRYCTFYLDGHCFGIDVMQVQEVIRFQQMTPVPLVSKQIAGLINLRGQIVTAIDLRRRLELPARPAGVQPMNLVVRSGGGAVSFLVDEIGDVVEVTDESYERPPETLRGIARQLIPGTHKLSDRLLLVLDADSAVAVANGTAGAS